MCFSIKSPTVVAEYGFKYPMVSPRKGHPIFPGGRLSLAFFLFMKMMITVRARMEERKQKVRYESDMELS